MVVRSSVTYNEPLWLSRARRHLGVAEIPGVNHHPLIVGWWKAIHRGGIKDDETPWCAAFVGAMLEGVGIVSSRFEGARSYLDWGVPLNQPVVGCIAVFTRNGGGHVGFVVGEDENCRLMVLGGNQGNEVSVRSFPRERLATWGYRWPLAVPVTSAGLPLVAAAKPSTSEA